MESLLYLESLWVVDEGTVNASLVWTFDVNELVASLPHVGLSHEVVERVVVFHLAHANDAGTVWQLVCTEVATCTSHIRTLVLIFVLSPMERAVWQEIVVVFALIVISVE